MKTDHLRPITVRLPDATLKKLKKIADRERRSLGGFLRVVCDRVIEWEETPHKGKGKP